MRDNRNNRTIERNYYNRHRESGDATPSFPPSAARAGSPAGLPPSLSSSSSNSAARASTATRPTLSSSPNWDTVRRSPAIYAIRQRHGLNRLTPPMQQPKRKIIKTRAGELGHLDCRYLGKD